MDSISSVHLIIGNRFIFPPDLINQVKPIVDSGCNPSLQRTRHEGSCSPIGPVLPSGPVGPLGPLGPEDPVGPDGPEGPDPPERPDVPVPPVAPGTPGAPFTVKGGTNSLTCAITHSS